MTNSIRINRTRRNTLKAATLVGGALIATATMGGAALANDGPGGDGHHGRYDPRGGRGDDCGDQNCFRRGTSILTVDGYRPIETLKAGDRLVTQFSGTAPIKTVSDFTIGRSNVDNAWPEKVRPVLVKRGALGESLPTADLCLTASHSIFKDGFLVPVGDLINDTSIVFDEAEGHDVLEFFHITLEKHDVIYANGAPCESLRAAATESCVPVLSFNGNRGHLTSRLRSAASAIVDRRRPLDMIRDELEERASSLSLAA
jgi:hypothetical protein